MAVVKGNLLLCIENSRCVTRTQCKLPASIMASLKGQTLLLLVYFFRFSLCFSIACIFFTARFHESFKIRSILADGRPSDNREQNYNAHGLRDLCMSYTCMCISASKKSAISSFLRGGSLYFQTKWRLAVNLIGICSRRYQHLQLS